MQSIIKNPGEVIRGTRLIGGSKPIEILVRFTQENIKENPKKTSTKKETHTGLCKNCLRSKDCIYKNPVSAIWHCEEYE